MIVQDSSQDFSSDFERSDPSKTPPSSEALERILVGILVKDFFEHESHESNEYKDNPSVH